jgi:hypothetical protein
LEQALMPRRLEPEHDFPEGDDFPHGTNLTSQWLGPSYQSAEAVDQKNGPWFHFILE